MAGGKASRTPGGGCAILAALALGSLWIGAPAVASSNTAAACSNISEATLELPANDLKKAVVTAEVDAIRVEAAESTVERFSPARLLSPGSEAAADEFRQLPTSLTDEERRPLMQARVPGVSDKALSRYKRQMYRKDI